MRKTSAWAALALAASTIGVGIPTPAQSASSSDRDSALEALAAHPGAARAAAGQAFGSESTIVDRDGSTHVRLQRTYRGLPVVGGDLVVHQNAAGALKGVSQTLRAPLGLAVAARVVDAVAETVALAGHVNRSVSGERVAGEPTLVVDATGATPRLAWRVTTTGVQHDGTPSRLASYVDARTGRLIRAEQEIVNVDGDGQSLYGGTVPLRLTQSGASYQLKDPTRGNTYTTDMNNRSDSALCSLLGFGCQAGTLFASPDTHFGNGPTSTRELAGVDAQYGTNVTWDYYKNVHNRNGIFGNGTGSFNRVHYGNRYVNAFWDGKKMTYGDGDGVNFGPLVSLDVAGHEMSHGVTENSAKLTYSGEPGGLNESTSDIFGTLVEFYAANANDPGDYLIGEEFDLKKHLGFRRMDKPSSDGSSANCWSSKVGNLDVHYSSGVGNHFFYLLAEGSGAKLIGTVQHNSPTCNGSTVTGIGRDKAGKIWYRALTVYMTSNTKYAGARTASLNAARDLYGAGSVEYNTVAAAWSAVNVN
jgi:Zn-dependent metalloprotease